MGFLQSIRDQVIKATYMVQGNEMPDAYDEQFEEEMQEEVAVPEKKVRLFRPEPTAFAEPPKPMRHQAKVVHINGNLGGKIVIAKPETMEEARVVCAYLKESKAVVVNLEDVPEDIAQRIIDFLGGVAYSLEGEVQYVSNKIFVVAPWDVEISPQAREALERSGVAFKFK